MTTAFAFLEALSSLVDMLQGHHESLGVVVTTTSAAAVRTIPTYMQIIPYDTWNSSWLSASQIQATFLVL